MRGVLAMRFGLGVLLVVAPSFTQTFAQTIACDESRTSTSGEGHNVFAYYSFHATAGEVISFESRTADDVDVHLSIYRNGERVLYAPSDSTGDAWICGWSVVETGNYVVFQEGVSNWGWSMSLAMYCGTAPEPCQVSVAPRTWTQIKRRFRDTR